MLDPAGRETVLYSFSGGADGGGPLAGVIRDSAGNLYGTTGGGGTSRGGVVYKVDVAGHETVLYSFSGGADGGFPNAGVIRDKAGNLYGTTLFGGMVDGGVVYVKFCVALISRPVPRSTTRSETTVGTLRSAQRGSDRARRRRGPFCSRNLSKGRDELGTGRGLPSTQGGKEAGDYDRSGSGADSGGLTGNRGQTSGGRGPGRGAPAVGAAAGATPLEQRRTSGGKARNFAIGSTLAARQAGIMEATRAARPSSNVGSGLGHIRYVVERSFAWLHRHRRLATCYERRPDLHDALLGIGCILICWRHLERSS